MVKIAVIVGTDGLTSSIFQAEFINVYNKSTDNWDLVNSIPVYIDKNDGVAEIRQTVMEIARDLEDCNIIAGVNISGIPYNVLNKSGFSIFELQGNPTDFLDEIYKQHQAFMKEANMEVKAQDKAVEAHIHPVETDIAGNYKINLIKAQQSSPSVSSKKMLMDFLHNTPFYQLEVICSHVPPWFEAELPKLGLKSVINQLSANEFLITICRETCNERGSCI